MANDDETSLSEFSQDPLGSFKEPLQAFDWNQSTYRPDNRPFWRKAQFLPFNRGVHLHRSKIRKIDSTMNGREFLHPSDMKPDMLLCSTIRQRNNPVGYFGQKPFKQANDRTGNRSVVAIKNRRMRRVDRDWHPAQSSREGTHATRMRRVREHER